MMFRNRLNLIAFVLFLTGCVCFGTAGYFYRTMYDVFETLTYYGLEGQYHMHAETVDMITNLKLGIVKFSIGGLASWAVSIFLIWRERSPQNQ